MGIKDFISELEGERVEGQLVKTVLYGLIASAIVLALLYFFKFRYVENFSSKYGLYLILVSLSYVLVLPLIKQVKSYDIFPCMSGMMIGMTAGMVSGFLSGFMVGATNGMFIGGVFGMVVGILLGMWLGRCCGVMGMMEGIMAGFMGGWMGAMTSVMLLNDHIQVASVIVFFVNAVIVFMLNYMIYAEKKEHQVEKNSDNSSILFILAILLVITSWIMIYGPKGGLLQ